MMQEPSRLPACIGVMLMCWPSCIPASQAGCPPLRPLSRLQPGRAPSVTVTEKYPDSSLLVGGPCKAAEAPPPSDSLLQMQQGLGLQWSYP
jgi:hypothetical protein